MHTDNDRPKESRLKCLHLTRRFPIPTRWSTDLVQFRPCQRFMPRMIYEYNNWLYDHPPVSLIDPESAENKSSAASECARQRLRGDWRYMLSWEPTSYLPAFQLALFLSVAVTIHFPLAVSRNAVSTPILSHSHRLIPIPIVIPRPVYSILIPVWIPTCSRFLPY